MDEGPRGERRRTEVGSLRWVLLTVLVSLAVVFAAQWVLNSTRFGLHLKCTVFNDAGACLLEALTAPIVQPNDQGGGQQQPNDQGGGQQQPAATPDPAVVAAQERAAVDQAMSSVNGDLSSLASDIGAFTSLSTSVNADVQTTYKDTNVAYAALQKVQSEGGSSPDCRTDAYTVTSDSYTVTSDHYTLQSDQYSEQSDVQSVSRDISTLDADFQRMQAAQAVIPSYQPSGLPTADQISQADAQANSANSQADTMIATALKQASDWVGQASQYATDAQAVCG